jgi:tetratricopeptide (TPR) repeat protein
MAVKGYDVEVEKAFKEVLELSQAVGVATQQYPVLRTLATYYINIADPESAQKLGRQILEMAQESGDETMLIEGHYVTGASTAFMGDIETGLSHLDMTISLFDPAVHGASRFRLGPHTGVLARVASGLLLWQCGGLERAIARLSDALTMAVELQHPYSHAYAIYHNGFLELSRSRFPECLAFARHLAEVAGENDYAVWKTLARVLEGVSLTFMGHTEEGLKMTESGIELYQGLTTPPVFWPLILLLRGLVNAHAGNPERGLGLIEEAITLSGPQDVVSAEFLVGKGDVLRLFPKPDLEAAQAAYESAAQGASEGGLGLIQLQALTRLVGLRREMGIDADGVDDLRMVYDRFSEGFDEHDLVAAREVLGLDRDPSVVAGSSGS